MGYTIVITSDTITYKTVETDGGDKVLSESTNFTDQQESAVRRFLKSVLGKFETTETISCAAIVSDTEIKCTCSAILRGTKKFYSETVSLEANPLSDEDITSIDGAKVEKVRKPIP